MRFYAKGDELAFHAWVGRIKPVRRVKGVDNAILLPVASRPSDEGLRELLALFHRYRIEMSQLAQFGSPRNQAWFADPRKYWHRRVFRAAPTA